METKDKYIISEFYAFTPDAKLIKEAEEQGRPITMSGILQRSDAVNRNGRVYPKRILAREVDKYMESVKNRTSTGECVPAGTKVYTENGWKNIENINIGEKIYTLNTETNKLELQSVENTISKNYKDDMIHVYNGTNLDFLVTKRHKVVLWDRYNKPYVLTAEELSDKLKNNDSKVNHSHIKHSGIWDGEYNEYFTIPNSDLKIKSEDWSAFLGIYIAEGHCSGTKGGKDNGLVTITQTKEFSKQQIKDLLDKLPFEYNLYNNRQFVIRNENLFNHLRPLGNSSEKYIPNYAKNWNVDLLNILLTWLLIGDGRNRKNRNGSLIKEYSTISNKLSEDVYEIMLKLGHGATIVKTTPIDRYIADEKIITKEIDCGNGTIELVKEKIKVKRLIKAENSNELKTIHCRDSKGIYLDSRYVKVENVPFNDNVYCVSVSNKTWLMKYNDKVSWTHNCDHPDSPVVSLANVSHLVTEMWWEGDAVHGKIQILDTPAGNILKGLLKGGVMLGISSRGVGSVKNQGGNDVVQEDFELIAFDFVSSPSTPGAYLFKENKSWGLKKLTDDDIKIMKSEEPKNIDNISKYKNLINISNQDFWKK